VLRDAQAGHGRPGAHQGFPALAYTVVSRLGCPRVTTGALEEGATGVCADAKFQAAIKLNEQKSNSRLSYASPGQSWLEAPLSS